MSELFRLAQKMKQATDRKERDEATTYFTETLTFATADEIMALLEHENKHDFLALPVWAMNLAYRLACLQRPDDPELLRDAAVMLYLVGPDWDEHSEELNRRADQLEGAETSKASETSEESDISEAPGNSG